MKNKFNAIRVEHDGIWFDSKKELARFIDLKLLEKAKEITDLNVHPCYTLRAFDEIICKFIPDFTYIEKGEWIVEDVKSDPTITPSFRIKLKLFHANFPSALFRIHGIKKPYKSLKSKVKS